MDSTATPFVGRERELATLEHRVGAPGIALITGDPGIGKTRLADELAARAAARGADVEWGRCWEADAAPAFWPWVEVIRGVVRRTEASALRAQLAHGAADVAQLVGELRTRLPDVPDPPRLEAKQARFRLFDGVATLLANAAAARPLVVVLEDLHWADTPSLMLLEFVARRIRQVPLLLVGTLRDVDLGRASPVHDTVGRLARHPHCERMPLSGLAEADVRRWVEHALGADAAAALAASLVRDTDGNPLFVGEIVRTLAREMPPSDGARPYDVPQTVRDAIVARLRAYSPQCVEVLRAAAVAGASFTVASLRRIRSLATGPLLDALGEALAGRLIVAHPGIEGSYDFTHALVREALYDDLPLARRAELHRALGEALEAAVGSATGPHAAELARHFLHAANVDDGERAVRWAIAAAEHATTLLAHEDAVAHYARALTMLAQWRPGDVRRTCTTLLALGESRVRAGDPVGAEEAFTRAATLARRLDAPELLGVAALGLGEVERFHDRLVPLLEEALEKLPDGDTVLRVRLLSRLAITLYWAQGGRKTSLGEEAVAMARRIGHTSTLAYALAGRIATLSGPDDVEARLAAATELRDLADRCGDRELGMVGRGWCIADALALGEISRVRRDIDAFAVAADELRHPYFAWWSSATRTMLTMLEGRLADAETLAGETLRLGERAVVSDAMQVYAGHQYVLCVEHERHEQLEAVVHGYVQQFPHIPSGHCAFALLHADRGRFAEAEAEMTAIAADGFAALPRNPEWLGCMAVLAETSALLPGAPYAETLYALLGPYRHRVIVAGLGVLCSGSVCHFLGMLATRLERWEEAAAHLAEALRVHQALGTPPLVAYTQAETARLLLARRAPGDVERAAELRASARRTAEAIGMPRLTRRLLGLADAAVERPPSVHRAGMLRKEGDYWLVRWDASEFRLRDAVGLHYLALLIGNPAREFLAIDLVASAREARRAPHSARFDRESSSAGGDLGPLLDRRARLAYRRRLEELRAALAEAESFNDVERAARTQGEIDALAAELARAVGLSGRERRAASPIERARVSATRAIRSTVRRIRDNDAGLARHLAATVRTGTFCSYTPDPGTPVSWTL